MGLLSRIRSAFTRAGKKQSSPKAQADYNGQSPARFYGQKFDGGLPSPAPSLNIDSDDIRQQVRALSHNSLQLRALLERDTDTVIAQGLNLSPEPRHTLLGLTPEAAEEWGSDVQTRFELWAMDNRAGRNGMYNFYQAQRLMRKSLYRDGELFVALSYHNDKTLLSPLRFQILDPSQIRENGMTATLTGWQSGTNGRQGIMRNGDGEETAYKVWNRDKNGIPVMAVIPRIGRGGRYMMLHALTGTDYAGQLRGISPFAVCVQDLENILSFTLAQVEKAKIQSNVPFTVQSESDEPAANPFIQSSGGAGPAIPHVQYGAEPEPGENAKNVTEESLEPSYTEIPNFNFSKPGSYGIFSLKGHQRLVPFPDTSPSQSFNAFVDAYFAYIASALGQSIETVLMKFNQNYSASRATLILTWRIAEQRRWEMDYYILGPMYEMWLAEENAAGRISSPGWSDPILRAAWAGHRYQGLAMPVMNPTDFMQASKMAVEMGATTMDDMAQEYNDSDYGSNCIKNSEAYKSHPAPPWGFTGNIKTSPEGGSEKSGNKEEGGKDGNA